MSRNPLRSLALAALACLLTGASALHATAPPQLWPTFTTPSTIVNVNLVGAGQAGDDYMATTTLQGAYNQLQNSTRLYVSVGGDDPYWLTHAVPSGITVSTFSFTASDPEGALKALLTTYGSSIAGYYICDPYNAPESCNMAMTLAGINDAMVVNPDNLAVMSGFSVPLMPNGDLRTYSTPVSGQYTWIGSNSGLVSNTAINKISNPSGSGGTTGWSTSGGSISTGTGSGTCAGQGQTLEFTRTSGSGDAWTYFDPAITASATTRPYIFSVQVCVSAGSPVFLDAYNGGGDVKSSSIAAGAGWQTLQLAVPIPLSGAANGNTVIKLQVRTSGSSTTAFFHNAAAVGNRVAIDTYQYNNLLAQTNSTILAQDFANSYNLRDYQVAAKMFSFDLSQDNADEIALYNNILTHLVPGGTARAHNTPVMGYIDDENNDVPYLSASGRGLFLNASDDYNNGSVWASLPQPSSLSQPAPAAISTTNGTVYVALAASDGDNASIVQHQNVQRWTHGQFLGAVPMAWTMPPGMIYNSPGIISNFYQFLPQSHEIMSGPSGVGYTQSTTGSDTAPFATLTNEFMTMDGMSTVTNWSKATSDLDAFALDVNVPHVVWRNPQAYTKESNTAGTVLDGQDVAYHSFPADEISNIESYVSSNWSSGAPLFVEALDDNLTTPMDDVLYIAQQLQLNGGHPYVFMTPSEMALTEKARGSVPTNAQAVAGSTLTTAYPQNLIWNADGQEPGAGVTSTSWALGSTGHDETLYTNQDYQGGGNMELHVPGGAGVNCYAYEYLGASPEVVVGRYYRFSVNVAGTSGATAFMTIYDGTANHQATAVLPASGFVNISQVIQMQSATAGQIQVGVTPETYAQTLYFGGTPSMMPGWFYSPAVSTTSTASFGATTYASAQGNAQAFFLNSPANDGSQWIAQFPTVLAANTTYTASVDVAGTGQAYLDLWNGGSDATSSTVNLSNNWQTVTATMTTGSSTSGVQYEIRMPSSSSAQEVFFRNASLVKAGSGGTSDFYTGLESGYPPLSATNTVDSTSPGGGDSNVSSTILQSTTSASRGGSTAIQYGGTASGGASTHAYMEAFTSDSTTLSSASRLSYWIYPITPLGLESGASSMTGLNSTCAAIDITLTNGTALRNLGVKDQFGNTLNPASQCNHLQPDQWNYVTVNLSSLSGLTVSHIDIGYDQPGASGNYGGYVDDISLTH
jgi:hypothetical protein